MSGFSRHSRIDKCGGKATQARVNHEKKLLQIHNAARAAVAGTENKIQLVTSEQFCEAIRPPPASGACCECEEFPEGTCQLKCCGCGRT